QFKELECPDASPSPTLEERAGERRPIRRFRENGRQISHLFFQNNPCKILFEIAHPLPIPGQPSRISGLRKAARIFWPVLHIGPIPQLRCCGNADLASRTRGPVQDRRSSSARIRNRAAQKASCAGAQTLKSLG